MHILASLATLATAAVSIHTDRVGPAVRNDPLGGFVLHVYNDSSLYPVLKKGLQELGKQVFRYPSGTTSNEYHWNGSGKFDADSVWIASDSSYQPGFSTLGIHRGTSKNNQGLIQPSVIDDGDTTTYWWSHPDLPSSSGWFLLDFGQGISLDSISLRLGDLKPDSVSVQVSSQLDWVESSHDLEKSTWTMLSRVPAKSSTEIKFAAARGRYVAIRPIGPLPRGWKVRECEVWSNGRKVSVNDRDETRQTKIVATSAHPASRRDKPDWNWDFESYMRFVRGYPGAVPMICVNIGTGTVQEAAAWVRYANVVRKYGIARWQIGNELSAPHEEGGPLSGRQYATRFVQFAKAMKAVDPTIATIGPVTDPYVLQSGSGDGDGRTWMEGFLRYVDSAEKADHRRYADGVDIHPYPYYFAGSPSRDTYMQKADKTGEVLDSLAATMQRTLSDRTGREVVISEYNTAISRSSLDHEVIGGSGPALMLAHFVQRFGDRGIALFFDLYTKPSQGPDGTYGALTAFLEPQKGAWSSLGYLPNSSFWALRTVLREWLDPKGGDTVVAIDQTPGVRTFAVKNHGQISILAVNLTNRVVPLQFDPSQFPNGAKLLQWGESDYKPTGTDGGSNPFPANGPYGIYMDEWAGDFGVAPYGMCVVTTGWRIDSTRTPFIAAYPAMATISDTFKLTGWSRAKFMFERPGRWVSGNASGDLGTNFYRALALSWTTKIPAATLGLGEHLVRIVFPGSSGDSAVDTVRLTVTGNLRPVVRISDFESGKPENVWGKPWWTNASAKIDSSGGTLSVLDGALDGSRYLSSKVHAGQSSSLGYDNFVSTLVGLPAGVFVSDSVRDVVGIGFDWKTNSAPGCRYALALNTSKVKDWDYHLVALPETQGKWTRISFQLSEFHQEGWGDHVVFDPSAMQQLEFRAIGACDATVSIDNLDLVGTRGAQVGVATRSPRTSPRFAWHNGQLTVDTQGAWTVRSIGVDGKTYGFWKGMGRQTRPAPMPAKKAWLVLEGEGFREIFSVAPLHAHDR